MTAVTSESFLSSEWVANLVWGVGVLLNNNDLYKNFLLKRGVGLFSRVGLISGDYGNCVSSCPPPLQVWFQALPLPFGLIVFRSLPSLHYCTFYFVTCRIIIVMEFPLNFIHGCVYLLDMHALLLHFTET